MAPTNILHKVISPMTWSHHQFQDPTRVLIPLVSLFHDSANITSSIIITYVATSYLRFRVLTPFSTRPPPEDHELEAAWTLAPGITLTALALPSLRLLYVIEESVDPHLIIKITAHQWYWSYDYAIVTEIEFDSFIIPTTELTDTALRLLEVDNRLVLPWALETRLLLTSADVLHSWTVPSIGVKADAIPGRLNQIIITPTKTGIFYGQCSEICGANHSFIPIVIEILPHPKWIKWVSS